MPVRSSRYQHKTRSKNSRQQAEVGHCANKDNQAEGLSTTKQAIDHMQLPERKKDINRQA